VFYTKKSRRDEIFVIKREKTNDTNPGWDGIISAILLINFSIVKISYIMSRNRKQLIKDILSYTQMQLSGNIAILYFKIIISFIYA